MRITYIEEAEGGAALIRGLRRLKSGEIERLFVVRQTDSKAQEVIKRYRELLLAEIAVDPKTLAAVENILEAAVVAASQGDCRVADCVDLEAENPVTLEEACAAKTPPQPVAKPLVTDPENLKKQLAKEKRLQKLAAYKAKLAAKKQLAKKKKV